MIWPARAGGLRQRYQWRNLLVLWLLLLAACQTPSPNLTSITPAQAATTTEVLPTFGPSNTALAPTETLWLEQPFGNQTLLIIFYEAGGRPCLRYQLGAASANACQQTDAQSLTALQTNLRSESGEAFQLVVGRAFNSEISTVSVQFADSTSQALSVDGAGFIVLLPGQTTARQIVPINAFGNMVGAIFKFN
jgi:hypothetical protein